MLAVFALLAASCGADRELSSDEYLDRVHGSWVVTMVANHSGLPIEGRWIESPGADGSFELVLLDQWSTDDDTHVEWLDVHILETHGFDVTPEEIRDEWVDHLNGDIWVSTRAARNLMDSGLLPPATGQSANNPDGAWSIDAQLETELFGLLHAGDPVRARADARRFAQITNSGPAVDASAFYAHLFAEAFFDSDIAGLIDHARASEPDESLVAPIVDDVVRWHSENRDDWRATRALIRDRYDIDPEFWGSRVNFASTIMALLYGDGDLKATIDIAGLAGWDADNNMTTAGGLLGVMVGFDELPAPFDQATDVYVNEDLTNLPSVDSVRQIAERTVALGLAADAAVGS